MVWFKVDDTFYGHPKAAGMSNDALATWTRAGNWSGWQLTDGAVPADLARTLTGDAADPEAVLRDLVRRELWETADDGYQFHDWSDYNPTREQVMTKRKKGAARLARWRETHGNDVTDAAGNGVSNAVSNPVSNAVTHPVSNAVSNAVRNANPDPTRPEGEGLIQVGDQSTDRNARDADDLDGLIQALMFGKTGKSITRDEAAAIRVGILSGRNVDNPAAYIRSAIATKTEARRLMPHRDSTTGSARPAREIVAASRRPGGPSADPAHQAQIARKLLAEAQAPPDPLPGADHDGEHDDDGDRQPAEPEPLDAEPADDDPPW